MPRTVQKQDSESCKIHRFRSRSSSNCSQSSTIRMEESQLLDFGAHLEDTPFSVKRNKTVQVGLCLQNPRSVIDSYNRDFTQ